MQEVAEGVGGIIASFVGVDFQNVLRAIGVVLQGGDAGDEPRATGMDEESRPDLGLEIPQSAQYLGPAVDTVGVGAPEWECVQGILVGYAGAVVLPRKNILACDDFSELGGPEIIALEQEMDGFGVAVDQPALLGVFIEDVDHAVGVFGGE